MISTWRIAGLGVALTAVLGCGNNATSTPPPPPVLSLETGRGDFTYRDSLGNADRPIHVRYSMPPGFDSSTPIVFVMHGASRAGQRYFDDWAPEAERYGFLLLVPEFDDFNYPGSVWYNLGRVFDTEAPGTLNDEARWTFSALEHLFGFVKDLAGTSQPTFRIYGHSAGSQFVHRMLLLRPDAPVDRAVAANAGWYTLPVENVMWPYGLGGSPASDEGLVRRLGMPLTVLLGDADTDTNSSSLRNTPEARAQGPHRFERGHTFFNTARQEALSRGVSFGWVLDTVPDATHSNRLMAPRAAEILGAPN